MRPDTAAIKEHIPLNWSFLDYIEASAVKRRTLGPKTKEYSKIHRRHFRPCPRMNRHFNSSHHKNYCRFELKVGPKRSGGLGGFCRKLFDFVVMSGVDWHDVSENQSRRYSSWYRSKGAISRSQSFFTRFTSIFGIQFHCEI